MFITIEGGEGAGKSTFADELYTQMIDKYGADVMLTREPGGIAASEKIREILKTIPVRQETELLLFLAARSEFVKGRLLELLRTKDHVICDRFYDSTFAYQGQYFSWEYIRKLHELILGELKPDLTILLDIDPVSSFKRIGGPRDPIETKGRFFHENVRDNFLQRARQEPDRFFVLDAELPTAVLVEKAMIEIERRLSDVDNNGTN